MNRKYFEYFLNAVFYQMWLNEKRIDIFIKIIINNSLGLVFQAIYNLIRKIFSSYDFKKYDNWRLNENRKLEELFSSPVDGLCIGGAKYWFDFIYSAYFLSISFIISGFIYRITLTPNSILLIAITAIPIVLAYISAEKTIYKDCKYLIFFKDFEKKDKSWHIKWNLITWVFIAGAFICGILGIYMAFSIALF